MRACICLVAAGVMGVSGLGFGCASNKAASGAGSSEGGGSGAGLSAPAGMKSCVMVSRGHNVLVVTAPSDAVCTPGEGSMQLKSHDRYVEFWLVSGAKTVDEGVARLGPTIEPEFKEFKPTSTTPTAVAGAPATRLFGTGSEADDGDPGMADIVVFQVGGRVFIACTHEEALKDAARQWMMELLGTARPL